MITHNCSFARKSLVKGERFSRSNAEEPEILSVTEVSCACLRAAYKRQVYAVAVPQCAKRFVELSPNLSIPFEAQSNCVFYIDDY